MPVGEPHLAPKENLPARMTFTYFTGLYLPWNIVILCSLYKVFLPMIGRNVWPSNSHEIAAPLNWQPIGTDLLCLMVNAYTSSLAHCSIVS